MRGRDWLRLLAHHTVRGLTEHLSEPSVSHPDEPKGSDPLNLPGTIEYPFRVEIKGVGSLYSGRVESGRKRSAETSGFPDTRVEPLAAITGGEENILASRNKGV